MKTRVEHLEWCKQRAREYLDKGEVANAIASMMSDLKKHPETNGLPQALEMLGIMYASQNDIEGARRFIEGFN